MLILAIIGYYIYSVPGHGSYFGFKYGAQIYKPEILWIDYICNFLCKKLDFNNNYTKDIYCLIGMSLRGLYISPLFISLSIYYNNYYISFLSFGLILQGLIYYVFNSLLLPTCGKHNIDCNACAEYATGGLIGVLIVIMKGTI